MVNKLSLAAALLLASSVATACPPAVSQLNGGHCYDDVQAVHVERVYVRQPVRVERVERVEAVYPRQVQVEKIRVERLETGAPRIDAKFGPLGRLRRLRVN